MSIKVGRRKVSNMVGWQEVPHTYIRMTESVMYGRMAESVTYGGMAESVTFGWMAESVT